MIRSIRTLAWLRDLVIGVLLVAGFNLRHTSTRLAVLLVLCALVVFADRVLWSWYLLRLRDQQDQNHVSA